MHPTQSLLPSVLLLLTLSSVSASFSGSYYRYVNCTPYPYTCGATKINIKYPFRVDGRPDYCGHPRYYIACSKDNTSMMVDINGKGYQVKAVDYLNHLITVVDQRIVEQRCPRPYQNTSVDFSLYNYSDRDRNVTLFINCSFLSPISDLYHFDCASNITGRHWYYQVNNENPVDLLGKCDSKVLVPMHQTIADEFANWNLGFGDAVKEGFSLVWTAGKGWCCDCVNSGGRCGYDSLSPANHTCYCPYASAIGTCSKDATSSGHQSKRNVWKVILIGCFSSAGVFLLLCVCFLFYWYKKRQPSLSSKSLIRNASLKPSLKDPEMSSAHLQTHLFSYTELQEATNCFDASKELGDGGFGTVYKGKLRDGRTVAVKRLYENNCRRLEQFMNEIDILSCLHHQSLVSLYGCTSRQSRELLLVYEFVPNGTVADHLHGSRASEGILTWSMRLNIAIETADALAYLHAVNPPIIHRDVKTSNILLDGSFHVKVADFGLSRFFPTDVTHISTAPQGTPGYLDPEYHQCYQLTDKSDVYSFGVVLIELISSKPAIDLTRHRSEINLANMAVTRIQNGELEQLVDADLGYLSDQATRKMMTMVGEVAFRCLQSDRDMRPPMMEILEALRAIESEVHKVEEKGQDAVENRDDAESLKNTIPLSPDSVMNKWASRSTTPNTSE